MAIFAVATIEHNRTGTISPCFYKIKILFNHNNKLLKLVSFVFVKQDIERGVSYLKLRPDRVAMQDATAQVMIIISTII